MTFIKVDDLLSQLRVLMEKSGGNVKNLAIVGCRVSGDNPSMRYIAREEPWHLDNQEIQDITTFLKREDHRLLMFSDTFTKDVDETILVILPCLKKLLCHEKLKTVLFAGPCRFIVGAVENGKLCLYEDAGADMLAFLKIPAKKMT
jgi:hypothetical protein